MPNQDLAPRSGCEKPLTRTHLCQTGVFCNNKYPAIWYGTLHPGQLKKKDRKSKELEKKDSKSGFARVFELDPPPSANAIGPSLYGALGPNTWAPASQAKSEDSKQGGGGK
ncbi:hypothetical protein V8C42DRAFT_346366 [Trichoderma barbatum]